MVGPGCRRAVPNEHTSPSLEDPMSHRSEASAHRIAGLAANFVAHRPARLLPAIVVLALAVPTMAMPAPVESAPRAARQELTGQTAGGAYFRIEVPDGWNGDLVIFCNGIEADNVAPNPPLGALAETQLAAGFAVATSSYRTNFYVLFQSLKDLRALVTQFRAGFGAPRRIILVGQSMGGLVAAEALEKGIGAEVVGALIYCGLTGGSSYLDLYGDLRLAYDVLCSRVPGGAIPGAAEGLPADAQLTYDDVVDRVIACTGVADPRLGPDTIPSPTPAQLKRQRALLKLTTIPDDRFLLEGMLVATFAVADSLHDRTKLRGNQAFTNTDVVYANRRIDRKIQRVEADRKGRTRLMRHYTPKGKLGRAVRIVGLHEANDGFVFVENLGEYASRVPADQLTSAVTVAREPGHCEFSSAELRAGWDALLSWIEDAPQPMAADIQRLCSGLADGGVAGPCRFAEEFDLGRIADRIPAR